MERSGHRQGRQRHCPFKSIQIWPTPSENIPSFFSIAKRCQISKLLLFHLHLKVTSLVQSDQNYTNRDQIKNVRLQMISITDVRIQNDIKIDDMFRKRKK